MQNRLILFILILTFPVVSSGSFSDAGGIFLLRPPSARSSSMGFTGVTMYEDPSSEYFNPGSIVFLQSPRTTYMNRKSTSLSDWIFPLFSDVPREPAWLDGLYPGMSLTYWAYTVPLRYLRLPPLCERVSIGYNCHYLCNGETEVVDCEGNLIRKFTPWDRARGLTFSMKFMGGIGIGFTEKRVYSFLCPSDIVRRVLGEDGGYAETETRSLGALFAPGFGIRYGFSYLDMGGEMKYLSHGKSDPLPHRFVNGYSIHSSELLGTFKKILNIESEIKAESILTFVYAKDYTRDMIGSQHEEWVSSGTEIGILGCFYIRYGHFEDRKGQRIGETDGYGIRIGPITYDIGNDGKIYDFPQDPNWRVSMTIGEPYHPFLEWRKNPFFVYSLGILAPGAGHIEIGDKYRGILYFGLTNLLIGGGLQNKGITRYLMLAAGVLIDIHSICDLEKSIKR
jgi:hypothetical protein